MGRTFERIDDEARNERHVPILYSTGKDRAKYLRVPGHFLTKNRSGVHHSTVSAIPVPISAGVAVHSVRAMKFIGVSILLDVFAGRAPNTR